MLFSITMCHEQESRGTTALPVSLRLAQTRDPWTSNGRWDGTMLSQACASIFVAVDFGVDAGLRTPWPSQCWLMVCTRSHKRGRKAKGEGHVERRYQDQRIERNRRSLTREQQPEPDEAGPEPGQEQQAAPLVAVQPAIDLVYLHLLSDEKGPVYMHFLSPADLAALECTSRAHKAVVKPMRKKAFAALKDPAHPHHHMLTDGLVDKHNILPFISLMAGRTRCAICREFIRRCDLRVANRSLRQQLTGTPLCHACGTSCKIRSHAFDLVDEVRG